LKRARTNEPPWSEAGLKAQRWLEPFAVSLDGTGLDAEVSETLANLDRHDAVVARAVQEFVLPVVWAVENADVRCDELGEKFRELSELEKAGVWILRKIPLREHPKAQQLLIVRLQMGEVAAQAGTGFHWINQFRWQTERMNVYHLFRRGCEFGKRGALAWISAMLTRIRRIGRKNNNAPIHPIWPPLSPQFQGFLLGLEKKLGQFVSN
jgi:hypothetical protein